MRVTLERGEPVADLGELEGPVLTFGGPCSNLEATRAVLAEARRRAIPPERVICTGDVAAYCADPAATVALVRRAGIAVVMGNCEESLAAGAGDCGCGFAEDSACARLSAEWYAHAAAELDAEAKGWMRRLPRRIRFRLAGRRLAVVHGATSRINRYLFASSPADDKAAEIALAGADGVVAGHSGLPFSQLVGGRLWHNPGIVGVPANDGTPRAWYGVLRPAGGAIVVEHHAITYDHAAAAARMRRRGLPAAYADSLSSGLWPNCDVLPPAEVAARGRALSPAALAWPLAEPLRAAS